MRQTIKKLIKEEGFTLIETTIVLLVIAMLSVLILPNISKVSDKVTHSTDRAIIATVDAQMELYMSENPTATANDKSLLVTAEYITQEQLDAYILAKPKQ